MTVQTWLRARHDQTLADTVALNSNTNWAAGNNGNVTVLPHPSRAGWLFRVRAEFYSASGDSFTPRIEVRKNSGSYVVPTDYPLQDPNTFAGSQAVAYACTSSQYNDGDATTNVMTGAVGTFSAGEGAETAVAAAKTLSALSQTEYEWLILIPPFYDTAGTREANVPGDWFDIRVTNNGTAFATPGSFRATLANEAGYIGGVYAETPGNVGPIVDGNGAWYIVSEDTEGNALIQVMKSTDYGTTWTRIDAADGPTINDLEATDIKLDGDTLYILHHATTEIRIHEFNVSTHSTTPDQWGTVDTLVKTLSLQPVTQVCSLEIRSDGDLVAFWSETNVITSQTTVYYRINTGSGWGSGGTVDTETSTNFLGPMTVKEIGSDLIHIFYTDYTNFNIYHRTFSASDVLSGRDTVSTDARSGGAGEQVALTNAVAWQSGSSERVMIGYQEETSLTLKTKAYFDNTPQTAVTVATNVLDNPLQINSRIPIATLAVDPNPANVGHVYAFWSDATSEQMYRDLSQNGGSWGTDTLWVSQNIHAARAVGVEGETNYQIAAVLETEGYWGYSGFNGAMWLNTLDLDPIPRGDGRPIPRGVVRGVTRGVT